MSSSDTASEVVNGLGLFFQVLELLPVIIVGIVIVIVVTIILIFKRRRFANKYLSISKKMNKENKYKTLEKVILPKLLEANSW